MHWLNLKPYFKVLPEVIDLKIRIQIGLGIGQREQFKKKNNIRPLKKKG